jgi:hypothetical protein
MRSEADIELLLMANGKALETVLGIKISNGQAVQGVRAKTNLMTMQEMITDTLRKSVLADIVPAKKGKK